MAEKAHAPNKGGRPPKYPGEGKRPTVTFRCRDALRAKIAASAESADRSLSEEIERILENHFQTADLRTLIREELEADRKRQREIEARGIHPSVYDAEVRLYGLNGRLKHADQSKPD